MPSRPAWDTIFMSFAETIGTRSRCSRGKIGCILVSADNQIISASYVGPGANFEPSELEPTSDCTSWCPRSQPNHTPAAGAGYEDCVSLHAEANAVSRADFSRLQGGTAYVNGAVCYGCAKLLVAAGVARVAIKTGGDDAHRNPVLVEEFFISNNVQVRYQ